ncbi:MAG: hypothetical protein D6B25_07080 [Desulfobulbaceae bacterium]|nr:MAG: hypothetical protein D6B25_07080 [Desulfobulbaceae bacterium]
MKAIIKKSVKLTALVILGLCLTLPSLSIGAQQQSPNQAATQAPSTSAVVPAGCSDGFVFDRNAGRMVKKSSVDLIVTKVEFRYTDSGGVAMRPTIKNRCSGRVTGNVDVAIDGAVVTLGPPPPKGTSTGSWFVTGIQKQYRVTVDHNDRVKESNERNNRCRATIPKGDPSMTYRCR